MSDGTRLNIRETDGDIIATDDISSGVAGGQKAQRVKVGHGADGSYADANTESPFPVNVHDQHTRALDLRFVQATGVPTTLSKTAVVDAHTIELTSTVGFVDGTYILVAEDDDNFFLATQQGAPVGSVITVDCPIDRAYASGTTVLATTYGMNVNGSVTPQVFQVGSSGSTAALDITRIMGYLQDAVSMDDSKFGSLSALTNGCILRIVNGENTNLWNVKTNADLALLGYDFSYPSHPPAGEYSARFRVTYAGQSRHGVTLHLAAGDALEFIIQDDLTGLDVFNMMAQGHVAG